MANAVTENLINVFMSDKSLYEDALDLVREYTELAPSSDAVARGDMSAEQYIKTWLEADIADMVEVIIDNAGNVQDTSQPQNSSDNCVIQSLVRSAFEEVEFRKIAARFIAKAREIDSY